MAKLLNKLYGAHMFQLNNLSRLTKKRKRIGRGGERGGTSGRGHKGQRARTSGNVRRGFEGGQMPLPRRAPKRGFNNARFALHAEIVNIGTLDRLFEDGATVDKLALEKAGLVTCHTCRIKVLGSGTLNKKFIISADAFSKGAQEAIEKAGGQTKVIVEG